MGDIFAGAIGSGAVRDFDGHLCIGTSSWLVCHVPFKKTDLFHNMASLPSAIPGRYLLSNEQESAGICLANLLERVLVADDEPRSGPAPDDEYERAFAMAERVPSGSDGLLFMPWLNGERSPVDDHLVRGGFANMSLTHTRAHLVRAVLEGVALNSRWLLTYVERFIDRKMEAVTAIGGGARSDLWCQIHADVLDRVVLQAEEPRLANCRGAAFQALVALGYLRWDELPDRVPIRRAFHPDPANRATYDRLFDAFTTLYARTKKVHASLNRQDQPH
jgi:xylulokinase